MSAISLNMVRMTHIAGLADERFGVKGREDLAELPLDERIVRVAVGVMLDQYRARFVEPTLLGEPARRLGSGNDERHDEERSDYLDDTRKAPAPFGLDVKTGDCCELGKGMYVLLMQAAVSEPK